MGNNLQRQENLFSCFNGCAMNQRQVFTNTDGSERVEPVMVYYFPKRAIVYQFPDELMGTCEEDAELYEVVKKGMKFQLRSFETVSETFSELDSYYFFQSSDLNFQNYDCRYCQYWYSN